MGRNITATISLKDRFTEIIARQQRELKRFQRDLKSARDEIQKKRDIEIKVKTRIMMNKLGINKMLKDMRDSQAYKQTVKFIANTQLAVNDIKVAANKIKDVVKKPFVAILKLKDMATGALNRIGINPMSMALAGGIAGAGTFHALKLSGDLEQTKMSTQTLIKDQKGIITDTFIKEMQDFAIATPFEFMPLMKNTKYAMAMGFQYKEIKSLMTDVGNAVSGVGTGEAGLEGVVRALGQIKTKGKLSAQEMNQLAEQGIGAWKYVAKELNITEMAAMKMGENGLIPAAKAIDAIRKGMREDFGGLMEKQARTLFGLMSTIKDFVNMKIFWSFGEGIRQGILPYLQVFVDGLTTNTRSIEKLQAVLNSAGNAIGSFVGKRIERLYNWFVRLLDNEDFARLGTGDKIISILTSTLDSIKTFMNGSGGSKIKEITKRMVEIIVITLKDAIPILMPLALDIGKNMAIGIFNGMFEPLGKVGDLLKGLAVAFLVVKSAMILTETTVWLVVIAMRALSFAETIAIASMYAFDAAVIAASFSLHLWNMLLYANPIGITIAAVALLIGAFVALALEWNDIVYLFQYVCEAMMTGFEIVSIFFENIFYDLKEFFLGFINVIIGGINIAINAINNFTSKKIGNLQLGVKIPNVPKLAMGLQYVPEDNYPAMLHKGERVLSARENRNYGGAGSITIAKLADQIIIREESDIEKIAERLVSKLKKYKIGYA